MSSTDEVHERDLRGVTAPWLGDVEHRLTSEQPADRDTVQPAGEPPLVVVRLDRVRPAEPVQPPVRDPYLRRDPPTWAALVSASAQHRRECGVHAHLKSALRLTQRPTHPQPVERHDAPRIRRPPGHGTPADRHRKHALPVGGEQRPGLQVGTKTDQPLRVGLVRRRERPRRPRRLDRHAAQTNADRRRVAVRAQAAG